MQRRCRQVVHRWSHQTALEHIAENIREDCGKETEVVRQAIDEQEKTVSIRCDTIEESLRRLDEEKCSTENLEQVQKSQEAQMAENFDKLQAEKCSNEELEKLSRTLEEQIVKGTEDQERLESKLTDQEKSVTDIVEALGEYAKSGEVSGMMRDVLLMWNSIKQLDAAKADKKDLDCFAVESSGRDKLSTRRLEDLESDVGNRVREEVLRAQERWSDLDGRVEENAKQFRHWERMWEKLAGFVEDLVTKISELQGAAAETVKLPPAPTNRPGSGGRASSRDVESNSRPPRRPASPVFPSQLGAALDRSGIDSDATVGLGIGAQSSAAGSGDPDQSRMLWIGGARAIVDATLDQAMAKATPASMRPPRQMARPKSASSSRKPHDRGR